MEQGLSATVNMDKQSEDAQQGRKSMPSPPTPGHDPDKQEAQVSEQHLEMKEQGPVMTSVPRERQSVDVKPMRYVLSVGIALAILAMILAYALTGGN